MKALFSGGLLLFTLMLSAQVAEDSVVVDSRYLEDQFYIGVTYNFLLAQPEDVGQQSLSYGLRIGLIKDIPLNPERTVALGVGLGYGGYSYYSNLVATQAAGTTTYGIVDTGEESFKRNKVETHMIEVPIEFRWRNSTPAEYKFWRIYTGVNFAYLAGARSKYITTTDKFTFTNTDVTKFQYGLTLNLGWNTFNIHAYYALNKLFQDSAQFDGQSIAMKPLRLGFIFYIL